MMLQVAVLEANLQLRILEIFAEWLRTNVHFTQSRQGHSVPDISGAVGQHTVLLVELKTDRGGNARAELLVRTSP
jgi:hypothetical protein